MNSKETRKFFGYNPKASACSPDIEDTVRVINIEKFIPRKEAFLVIEELNRFTTKGTKSALGHLFKFFIWEFNDIPKRDRKFIDIDFNPNKKKSGEKGRGIDSEKTASTTGWKLWINAKDIMNGDFDEQDTHFGRLPKGVSHYAAVILHEFGHVLRERGEKTTFPHMMETSPLVKKCFQEYEVRIADAYEEFSKARASKNEGKAYILRRLWNERKDELEEWFADMFAKSFIVFAMTRTRWPKRRKTDAPVQEIKPLVFIYFSLTVSITASWFRVTIPITIFVASTWIRSFSLATKSVLFP